MKPNELPVLYIKPGCPWCEEASACLQQHGIGFLQKDVSTDLSAAAEMNRLSGQTKVPTLDWHGDILADFGLDELIPFLHRQEVELEDS